MRSQRCAAAIRKTQDADRTKQYCENIMSPGCRTVVGTGAFLYRRGCRACWPRPRPVALTATWRSGYAAVCKTVYPGSIPGVASKSYCFHWEF